MRSLFLAAVLVAIATPAHAQNRWATAGIIINPTANTILADTGPLSGPSAAAFQLKCTATAAAFVAFEHRDAANTAVVTTTDAPNGETQAYAVQASSTTMDRDFIITYADQDRIRVRLLNGIAVGQVQCSIAGIPQ